MIQIKLFDEKYTTYEQLNIYTNIFGRGLFISSVSTISLSFNSFVFLVRKRKVTTGEFLMNNWNFIENSLTFEKL